MDEVDAIEKWKKKEKLGEDLKEILFIIMIVIVRNIDLGNAHCINNGHTRNFIESTLKQ